MSKSKSERRSHPRTATNLALKICKKGLDLITETRNISCSGVYCRVNRPLPLMSKIGLTLLIPIHEKNKINTAARRTLGNSRATCGNEGKQENILLNGWHGQSAACPWNNLLPCGKYPRPAGLGPYHLSKKILTTRNNTQRAQGRTWLSIPQTSAATGPR